MYQEETIYYPPDEMFSVFIPVTGGCSYNKCAFCSMYKDLDYHTVPIREIEANLVSASEYNPYTERIFLTGAEPLAIGFERMMHILELVRKYLPYCACVASYASVKNMRQYSQEQLKTLHNIGLRCLYVGLESGSDRILERMKKGHTAKEAVQQMQKLNRAKLSFHTILMYGVGGAGTAGENAAASAEMVNQFETQRVIMMNLTVFPGTELDRWVRRGSFIPAGEAEKMKELYLLLERLEPQKDMVFDTTHTTNTLRLKGIIPGEKEKMLKKIEEFL